MKNERKRFMERKKEINGDLLFSQSITTNLYKSRLFGCFNLQFLISN